MADLNSLRKKKENIKDDIKTLKRYKEKFGDLKEEVITIREHDRGIKDEISFWKGKKYTQFKEAYTAMMEGERKYQKHFTSINNSINSRISQLDGQLDDVLRDIRLEQKIQGT